MIAFCNGRWKVHIRQLDSAHAAQANSLDQGACLWRGLNQTIAFSIRKRRRPYRAEGVPDSDPGREGQDAQRPGQKPLSRGRHTIFFTVELDPSAKQKPGEGDDAMAHLGRNTQQG